MTLIFLTLLICYILLFLYSLRIRDNSIVDVFWGFGFMIIALVSWLQSEQGIIQYIMTGLVLLWGVRLTSHIGFRKFREAREDPRYAAWRAEWGSGWYFVIRSFLQVYVLQMVLMLVVAAPILIVNLVGIHSDSDFCSQQSLISQFINQYSCKELDPGSQIYETTEQMEIVEAPRMYFRIFQLICTMVGIFVALSGFIFETIADRQLTDFLKIKKPGQVFMSGLYKYSRHPNYFGESVFWLGVSLISLPFSYIGIIGWITITCLLLCVSGVPLQESRYAGRPDWEEYKKRTSVFVPWSPSK